MRRLLPALAASVVLATGLPAASAMAPWTITAAPLPAGVAHAYSADISCAGTAFCVQVAASARQGQSPFAVIHDGTDVSATVLPLPIDAAQPDVDAEVNAIDCVTANFCIAVGGYGTYDGRARPLAETYRDGVWHASAVAWPSRVDYFGPDLADVACNRSTCVATGSYYNAGNEMTEGFVSVRASSGTWTSPQLIDPTFAMLVRSPVCTPDGPCYAQGDGYDFDSGHEVDRLLYPSSSGWRGSNFPAPTDADPNSVAVGTMACPSQDYCAAVAVYRDLTSGNQHLAAESFVLGRLRSREIVIAYGDSTRAGRLVPGPTACGSVAAGVPCAASATFGDPDRDGSGHALLISSTSGTWHATRAPVPSGGRAGSVRIQDVSCPPGGRCATVGRYNVGRTVQPVVLQHTPSGWVETAPGLPAGTADGAGGVFDAVSCAASSLCMASGSTRTPAGYSNKLIYASR